MSKVKWREMIHTRKGWKVLSVDWNIIVNASRSTVCFA